MNANDITTLRAAAVTESKGTGALVAYGKALVGMDAKALDRELAQYVADGGSKSYASALRRIATGKADGDLTAANVMDYAYASKATQSADRKTGDKKAPKVWEAKALVAAFGTMSAADKKRFFMACAVTHGDLMKDALEAAK